MNATPPPLGDPTKVQAENSAAVGKGILFGCSGCLLVIFALMLFAGAIVGVVMYAIRSSDVAQLTLVTAQASPEMKAELGEPMEIGWFITGSVKSNGGNGQADVHLPIAGPNGSASVHAIASKKTGGVWEFTEMTALIEGKGKTLDLRRK